MFREEIENSFTDEEAMILVLQNIINSSVMANSPEDKKAMPC